MELKYTVIYLLLIHCSFLQAQINSSISRIDTIADLQKEAIEAAELCYDLWESSHEETVQKCKDALVLSKKAEMDSLSIMNLNSIASVLYFSMGTEPSHEYTLEAKQIAERSENQALKMPAYYNYSLIWERHIDIESAVDYLNKALKISDELNDEYHQSRLISGIGYLFTEAELYEDAKQYFTKALEIANKKGDPKVIALMEIYLALSYRELGEYEKSKSLYKKAVGYYTTSENLMASTMIIYGLAKLETKQGNYQASNDILFGKNKIFRTRPVLSKLNKSIIANNYYKLGQYNKSLEYYNEILPDLNQLTDEKISRNTFRGLADCYSKLGRYEEATIYYQKLSNGVDSYIKEKLEKSINTAELKYELREKDIENENLTTERKNLMLQNRVNTLSFVALTAILALLSLILIYVYRKQKSRNKFLKAISSEQEKINQELLTQSQRKDTLNQELTIRNQELSSFAGIVAHDIKSPIRTTSGFIQLIRKHIKQDERLINYLSFIEKSNQQLSVLIDDLLAFTRSGKYAEANELIDLNEIIQTVKNNLTHQITQKSAEISAEQLPHIQANESALTQVFQNIITNSIKFTKSDTQPIIEITTKQHQDYQTILIKDNGIGIEKAYLDKIFDPLTKLHTSKEFEGSGLGLATCKKIIDHLGGTIEVESKLNEGSIFKINFPVKLLAYHTNQNIV